MINSYFESISLQKSSTLITRKSTYFTVRLIDRWPYQMTWYIVQPGRGFIVLVIVLIIVYRSKLARLVIALYWNKKQQKLRYDNY